MPSLTASTPQVSVKLISQIFAQHVLAVLFFHHLQRRIFRERLAHHVRALRLASNQLVSPPLVRQFMCRHEVEQVDVIRFLQPFDEPDAFRKRNRIRERLRKLTVSRVFQHPKLLKLKWTEILFVVVQPGLRGIHHFVEVVLVPRLIVDF